MSSVQPAHVPQHPELAYWASLIEQLRWAGFLLDSELRLAWVSTEIRRFLGSPPDEELGFGLRVVEVLRRDAWARVATPDSRQRFWRDLAPFVLPDLVESGATPESVPRYLAPLLEGGEAKPLPPGVVTSFDYLEPGEDSDLPAHRVDVLLIELRDHAGERTGVLAVSYMNVRPGLVSLLARGDEAMYERMARLVEPRSREAAILFCDLQSSTELSRTLPSGEYFQLIRKLWTEIDGLVAANRGIVGKHAGDGASAFFLVDDLESASGAVTAATRAARGIHERSHAIFGASLESSCLMRVGLHWGSSLYIGQLVPGSRLDVTALGDAVNECARIQDCAEPHQTLASKDFIERLGSDDAASVGIELDNVRYRLLADLPQSAEKAIRAAGTIPVTVV